MFRHLRCTRGKVDATNFGHFSARSNGASCSLRPRNKGLAKLLAPLRPWVLIGAVAGLAMLGCGTPATLHVIAPPTAVAGSAFTITVSATVGTSPDKVINSPVELTSSDSAAVIYPAYYVFTSTDAGSHTFTNGVTLKTLGSQTITATIVGIPGLTATAHVTVTAP